MFDKAHLRRAFTEANGRCPMGLFEELAAAYSETGRHYHSATHVAECLKHFEAVRELADAPAEIELAIWFHDAIYDPKAGDNEERSAEWAAKALRTAGCAGRSVEAVHSMVLATKSHDATTNDAALMVDIDLGILGASRVHFERYDAQIRLEYEWVPLQRYREARREVLQDFLQREAIYRTGVLHGRYEKQARENLTAKVLALGV